MNRINAFASRNLKELARDPLSYIFCIGFPVVMLVLMTVVNTAIPEEANMTLFEINPLAAGISVFGFAFVMLFASILVSKDRASFFLARLRSTPMTAWDFINGYAVPLFIISAAQFAVTYLCSAVIALITDAQLNVAGVALSALLLAPTCLFFVSSGIFFGTVLSDKSAPPCCSILISLCGVLGGIWFDIGEVGGMLEKIAYILPFANSTELARSALSGDCSQISKPLIITVAWAIVMTLFAFFAFKRKMKEG